MASAYGSCNLSELKGNFAKTSRTVSHTSTQAAPREILAFDNVAAKAGAGRPFFLRYQPGFALGGPIRRDRLFFTLPVYKSILMRRAPRKYRAWHEHALTQP